IARPKHAKTRYITSPKAMPNAIPLQDRQPNARALPVRANVPGPGVMAKRKTAVKKVNTLSGDILPPNRKVPY
ncbi:hypothetical protein, partial [Desulfomarina sp.]